MSIHQKDDPYKSSTFGKSLSLKVDGGFNAISINPSARDVVLASRQGLYIIDLDDPFSPPRWLHHETPWQVADVQWSPHPAKPYWIVSTSNQKAIIWNLTRSSSNAIEYALHGHTRAITDINFNPQQPDILATCSVDTYVHAWDLRSPKRPFYSTSPWRSSASQVKWNFRDSNILASSHDNDVFIWDLRNGSTPLSKLEGHQSSVNSIDFNRTGGSEIMSSSNDGTVKFWNYQSGGSTESTRTVRTEFPIWRGRYLPFGNGYCVMPMVGGENSVYMMSLDQSEDDLSETKTDKNAINSTKLQPIYTFKGHSDRVIDFLWRSRHTYDTMIDDREFELVTWSKDCSLRLWPIADILYNKVNFERNKRLKEKLPNYEYITYNREVHDTMNFNDNEYKRIKETFVTTSGLTNMNNVDHLNWLSGVRMNDQNTPDDLFEQPKLHNLGEEVSAIGQKFPKVVFEKISVSTGEILLTMNGPWSDSNPDEYIFLRIEINVPSYYPHRGNAPVFKIEENGNLTDVKKQEILAKLNEIGKVYTDSDLYCLEQCLHYLLGEKVSMDLDDNIDEPLFYLDVANSVNFDEFSTMSESIESVKSTESSSDSGNNIFTNPFDQNPETRNTFGRNLAFDTTPVPNECGAIWTPTGKLLCFFSTESKPERKQRNVLKLTRDNLMIKDESKPITKSLYDDNNISEKGIANSRPKRYVDTFSANDAKSRATDVTSDGESTSDDSFGSFVDDWNDIVGNDIVVRTRIPTLLGNFAKSFGSVHSESLKTGDSSRTTKNIIITKDFYSLFQEDIRLALKYEIMNEHPDEMARHNALIAERYGYEEISHCWQILSDLLLAEREQSFTSFTWNNNPLGIKWFIKEAIKYFEKESNIQMLAMLCCVAANLFISKTNSADIYNVQESYESMVTYDLDGEHDIWPNEVHSQFSAGNTIQSQNDSFARSKLLYSYDNYSVQSEEMAGNVYQTTVGRTMNSRHVLPPKRNSNIGLQTPTSHRAKVAHVSVELIEDVVLKSFKNPVGNILDSSDIKKCQLYIYQYAKLLFRWGLPYKRVELLKISIQAIAEHLHENSFDLEDLNRVNNNTIEINWVSTYADDKAVSNCNYCNLKIKGSMYVCGGCQHVLHADCAKEWWAIGNECPSGCGCHCPDRYNLCS
ncbi:similar to Saccharomyces cerevisiae YDR128W MTC5 Subunit of the SEA (Seh1-associated) complex, a coatomer-related complex that associates dynamically with the vacuole [Maudiozyma barnettii]|uniref:Similar to Saccharomyces cerevisiae YDR128W MTC5 Subunit of the SEA (Seh1-associated) complex, a coatomer-related complex that associates dynamically with the vacuole n=1 Tax=Maudiozyma barnettii TaxID=61262 RepID=A0A8H2ZHF3_9SACH|nr:Mtc5p [Kazachstania barnettii]CAB4255699.1 similar to Saccharomyces cerevisiae YDR128W MTC5 Subunit of the SEA (Seh1-associated) complex, a coatomer-related complex that associates dynamically with the vacuole [Kazachstania barnettii]CAD1784260.1 similar to Saccharomyces cerevisiae YDR128W MTC5 Subunit of the SEA (Seh1-associated) complex, a coatomer-related complex that associates dynamically with the vacuole [Kazachstania barnettii]